MVEQSRLYPVNLLLNDHYCEWRVMAVSRCWPAPQIWTINIVHGLQSAPHPLPPPPDQIIYHLPVCVCLSVAQISLSMVFISTVIQAGFVYRWWYTCCAAVSCLVNKPSCHRDSSLGFWVLLLIYRLAAYILSWCRRQAGSISCIFLEIFLCEFAVLTRCGSGFNGVPGSVSGSWFAIRIQIQEGKNRKKLGNFMFWSAGCAVLRAEGFSCSLDVLYRGLGISKLQFWMIKKRKNNFSCIW